MAVRKKRSISMPPDLDAEIASAAAAAGLSYSAWLADTARKEFTIQAGLAAVRQFEEPGDIDPSRSKEGGGELTGRRPAILVCEALCRLPTKCGEKKINVFTAELVQVFVLPGP